MNIQETAVTQARVVGSSLELVTTSGILRLSLSGAWDDLKKAAARLASIGWQTVAYFKGNLYINGQKAPQFEGVDSYTVTFSPT